MNLSIFRILLFSLIGFISLTSSTVPASRTPKVKKTTQSKLAQKDKRIFKLKEKAHKQKKAKRQKINKGSSMTVWSWLSFVLGFLSFFFMLPYIRRGPLSWAISSMVATVLGLIFGILNFILAKEQSSENLVIAIFGLVINTIMIAFWSMVLIVFFF